ncbi:MAG: hypothetical protein ACJAT4_003332 [Granulosicoccus sp.]|jgi:hypothetical protein
MEELNTEAPKGEKKEKKNKKKKKDSGGLVDNSKGAQVMFKTALRNHIDLTNIADNKANIILTINAIILTIALPLLSTYASENHHLYVPAFFLLSTNMASIVYGALVTRPGKMQGKTDLTKIKEGRSNLFFFGNFYKMKIEEYRIGVTEIISDEDLIDKVIMTDLYYLGQALGRKYELLRTCYTVFMVGMILTVATFVVAFFTAHPS